MDTKGTPLVIDNGSGLIKAGLAGDEIPNYVFNNYVGSTKHVRVMPVAGPKYDFCVGKVAEEKRGILKLKYPMEHGVVTDWSAMERVWDYLYACLMDKDTGLGETFKREDSPVLLTEAPLNPRKNREKAADIFFESYNVPKLFISLQAVLSLYASGSMTGVVLDSGDGVTHCVPIYDGFAIPNAITRIDVAGRDITNYLQLLLRKSGYNFHTSSEIEVVKSIKESDLMYVAAVYEKEMIMDEEKGMLDPKPYKLPDGSIIQLGSERYMAPEILFKPYLIGLEYMGVHECVLRSIQTSDLDIRKDLYSNIFFAGGSTLFDGFCSRMLSELKKSAPKDVPSLRISAPNERAYTTWLGGSILASLPSFSDMWITKNDYEEHGSSIVHKKTF
ncbi:actin-related protein 1 [Naegleria gruberi]|uniref:Actin-related protein 1 n=1 Tax=Naegleria gruberi TaxID=5762 RepID=D2VQU2_NAEGR|nr:actin-related protein 1 [Naegleria gruberi]EFC40698.1 actin-related protein 1 [Naegleria gruberi]|eukprot:XP_002673442.1 actin-related protein 1 [Naegleria gruberi strain NEG-M]